MRPVGEDQSVKVDVRIIAATHRDLLQMVGARASFARISIIGSRWCICRCRRCASGREDIPLLARHFLGEYSAPLRRRAVQADTVARCERLNAVSTGRATCASWRTRSRASWRCRRAASSTSSLLPEPPADRGGAARATPAGGARRATRPRTTRRRRARSQGAHGRLRARAHRRARSRRRAAIAARRRARSASTAPRCTASCASTAWPTATADLDE